MSGIAVHGDTPFDVPYVSQVDGNLWSGGCATGLVLPDFIEHVVSLYPWEQYTIQHQPKSVSLHWLYDSEDMPPAHRLYSIARFTSACVDDGPTLVHCQAGLNRSGLIASLVLVERGWSPAEALATIREKRSPACLCNRAFESFLLASAV